MSLAVLTLAMSLLKDDAAEYVDAVGSPVTSCCIHTKRFGEHVVHDGQDL